LPPLKHLSLFWKPGNLKHLQAERKANFGYSKEKIEERIARGNDRNDFLAHLLSEKATDLTPAFLMAQAAALVGACSETTSTFLYGQCLSVSVSVRD
jgi:cytochrome P450